MKKQEYLCMFYVRSFDTWTHADMGKRDWWKDCDVMLQEQRRNLARPVCSDPSGYLPLAPSLRVQGGHLLNVSITP